LHAADLGQVDLEGFRQQVRGTSAQGLRKAMQANPHMRVYGRERPTTDLGTPHAAAGDYTINPPRACARTG